MGRLFSGQQIHIKTMFIIIEELYGFVTETAESIYRVSLTLDSCAISLSHHDDVQQTHQKSKQKQ